MSQANLDPPNSRPEPPARSSTSMVHLLVILLVAVGLRTWRLDAHSLWYDEVISMQVGEAPSPMATIALLGRIDGTRAPLHPLLLSGWLKVFGTSSLAGRAFSAVLGCGAVVLIYVVGLRGWDDPTGRWAAWLCAVCPPLVYYSQEVRMYALLVFLTVLSWLALLEFRRRPDWPLALGYGLLLAAIGYTHPLGLLMVATHGLVGLAAVANDLIPPGRWLAALVLAAVVIAPWLPRYLDHGTDYAMPLYSLRFFIGVPIEYIGGQSWTLPALGVVILTGLLRFHNRRFVVRKPETSLAVLCWFTVPLILMYGYSWLVRPIFGPSRYNLFVAPAYLSLIAAGLSAMPRPLRLTLVAVMAGFTVQALTTTTYAPAHKADWRSASSWIRARQDEKAVVLVDPNSEWFTREPLETARYYLGPEIPVQLEGQTVARRSEDSPGPGVVVYHVHCFAPAGWKPEAQDQVVAEFYGLTITRAVPNGGTR